MPKTKKLNLSYRDGEQIKAAVCEAAANGLLPQQRISTQPSGAEQLAADLMRALSDINEGAPDASSLRWDNTPKAA